MAPPTAEELAAEADIRIGDYVVQRRCPHRDADLEAGRIIEDALKIQNKLNKTNLTAPFKTIPNPIKAKAYLLNDPLICFLSMYSTHSEL